MHPLMQALKRKVRELTGGDQPAPAMSVTDCHRDDLTTGKLRADQILGGDPSTRHVTLSSSPDEAMSTSLWECMPGTFRWQYRSDEVVHILSGEVDVTDHTGKVATLVPGSVAYFPAGSHAVWIVKKPLRKLAVFRSATPSLRRRVLNLVMAIASRGAILGGLATRIDL